MNEIGNQENGTVKISDEVVSIIAGMTTAEIPGVASMAGGFAGGIAQMLGAKKNLSSGIKVDVKENDVNLDLHIIIEYGSRIPEVAWEIQDKTKKAIESMTGLNVNSVNVFADGIHFPAEEKKPAPLELDLEIEEEDL